MTWLGDLFGRMRVPPSAGADSPQDLEPPPSELAVEGVPSFTVDEHCERHQGYPLMAWEQVRDWLSRIEAPEHQNAAWREAKRAWLLRMRCALGPSFGLRESRNVLLLSSLKPNVANATLDYMERTLQRVTSMLEGIARMPAAGQDVMIVFDDDESYYRYVSCYYPEAGEFAFSGGMHIDAGCSHYVTIKADLRQIEPVIAHEMTHGCLGHLPLPAWLNEGLAMNVERRLSPTPQTHTPQQLRAKHLTFWTPQDIPLGAGGFSYEGGQLKGINLAQNASSTTQPLISQIQWQPFGPASSWLMHMASGTRSYERVFDAYGRLVRYPLNGVVRDLRYDAANRIVGYTHLDATTGQATAATQALEQAFGYDELGRLTTISTPAQSWTIGYDASGNRTQVTLNGTTRAYTTSATSNRLEQISNPVRSMSYDAAGNTLTDTTMYSSAVYSTDNRLTAITKAGQTTSYSYDAGGQRVSKSNAAAPAQARLFVYGSSPELLGEYAADGTAVQEVVWFDGQPLIVLGQANSNEVFFSYPDHLGAPRILVDRSGAERWRWIAEPFGSTAAETAPAGLAAVAFPLRLPGQYFDAETGLNYNYFRNYDSTIGQYTQSDPIGLAGGINTYAYVGGNPLGGIDPYGLFDITNPADWPQLPPGVAKCIESRRWDWGNMGPQGDGPPTLAGDLGTAGNLGNSAGNFAAGATGSGISSASHATSWQHRTGSQ